eukprot:scaffold1472_cov300-Pinguiococcus_pyrenoidosus.AAC.7
MWMLGNDEIFSSEGAKSIEEYEEFYERYDSFDVRSRLSQRHLVSSNRARRSYRGEQPISRGGKLLLPFLSVLCASTSVTSDNALLNGAPDSSSLPPPPPPQTRFINLVTCWTHSDVKKVAEHVSDALSTRVSYSHAKRRRLIRGLASYNILQNPVYKDLFHISDKFASVHKHLTSITKFEEHDHYDFSSKVVPKEYDNETSRVGDC